MGIVDGDYQYFNIESISDNIVNAFCAYYGENHRERITECLNNINVYFYNDFHQVKREYYNYINQFKDEIINNFYKTIGLERTLQRDKFIDSEVLGMNELKDIVYCNGDLYNQITHRFVIDENVQTFCEEFKDAFFEENTQENAPFNIGCIYMAFLDEISKFKRDNPKDVFTDFDRYQSNLINYSLDFINCAKSYQLPCCSKIMNFGFEYKGRYPYQLLHWDTYGQLFYDDLTMPGMISYFTSAKDDIINSKSDKRYYIYLQRLKYLCLNGVELKYLNKVDVLDESIMANKDNMKLLEKEYEYQKVYAKRYFVKNSTADSLENYRKGKCDNLYKGLKCYPQEYLLDNSVKEIDINEFIHISHNNPITNETKNSIFIHERDGLKNLSILSILIHELNHCLGTGNFDIINDKEYFIQNGLIVMKYYLENDGHSSTSKLNEKSEEYCNEAQTKDIVDIYLNNYPVPQFIEENEKTEEFVTLYDYYGLIAEDFYTTFKDYLKRAKMNDKDFYANKDFPVYDKESTWQETKNIAKSVLGSIFKTKLDGYVEVDKIFMLENLIDEFSQIINENKLDMLLKPQDLFDNKKLKKCLKNNFKDYLKIKQLLLKRDLLLSLMKRDLQRFDKNFEIEKG